MTANASAPDEPLTSYGPSFRAAVVAILCLGGTLGGWAMYARLDSAVVTSGVLLAESQRKTVEHFEGGILEQLLVRAGERVAPGQVVARLDATQVRAQLAQLESERLALDFDVWRLEAEEAGVQALDPAGAPPAPADAAARQVAAQSQLFEARRRAHVGQIASLRRQIDQLRAQIAASDAQARAAERQLASWTEERGLNQTLVDKGATARQKLLEIDRTIAALEGERDEQRGMVAAAEDDIARAETDIETLEQQRLVEIGERLAEARRQVDTLASRIVAARDVLARSELRAPQAGLVVHIYVVTPGAVVQSGAPLMDIVPDGDPLVVETRLPPEAIDTVHVGRKATVRLTAYRRADAPVLDGEVTYVSADLIEDSRDGSAYFDARVSLDRAGLEGRPDVTLTSGMPVEVAIKTGERRAGDYFLEPILRRAGRAMREE
jgi:HlyD family type I secretion membrane fusion protein